MNLDSLVSGMVIGQLSGMSEEKALEGLIAIGLMIGGMFLFVLLVRGIFALVSFIGNKCSMKE